MGSVSTIYNGVRQKLAGRALMDVAFSSTSTNGVQNKVIKAKFDEVDSKLTTSSTAPLTSPVFGTGDVFRGGNSVNIRWVASTASPVSVIPNNTVLAIIPEGYRPLTDIYISPVIADNNSASNMRTTIFKITTDGKILYYGGSGSINLGYVLLCANYGI